MDTYIRLLFRSQLGIIVVLCLISISSIICEFNNKKKSYNDFNETLEQIQKIISICFWVISAVISILSEPKNLFVYLFWIMFAMLFFIFKFHSRTIKKLKYNQNRIETKCIELNVQLLYLKTFMKEDDRLSKESLDILESANWFKFIEEKKQDKQDKKG